MPKLAEGLLDLGSELTAIPVDPYYHHNPPVSVRDL